MQIDAKIDIQTEKSRKMKKLMEQIIKFGVVGVLCFGIDFGIFYVLNNIVGVHYSIAAFFGFMISLIVNYILSMKYVFERKENADKRAEFIMFAILSAVGLVINEAILVGCVEGIYGRFIWIQNLITVGTAEVLAKLVATGVVMVYNFITRKIFIEKKEA